MIHAAHVAARPSIAGDVVARRAARACRHAAGEGCRARFGECGAEGGEPGAAGRGGAAEGPAAAAALPAIGDGEGDQRRHRAGQAPAKGSARVRHQRTGAAFGFAVGRTSPSRHAVRRPARNSSSVGAPGASPLPSPARRSAISTSRACAALMSANSRTGSSPAARAVSLHHHLGGHRITILLGAAPAP